MTGANALRLDYDWGPSGKNNGNLRAQTINGTIVQSYEHDRLDRLVKTVEGAWTQQNVFDRYGNRAVLSSAAGPYSLTGMTPQVPSATESAVEAVYPTANRWSGSSPDDSGNITGINGAALDYDAENRMTRAVVSGSTTGFGYDGEGRRVWKAVCAGTVASCKPSTVDASWTVFVYDASGALAAEYATVADGEPSGRKYLVADHLGSTRMTFGAGYATKRYDYMPYGESIGAGVNGRGSEYALLGEKVRFTGQVRDGETGLDYFGARYYGSAHGRFLGVDPGNAAGRVEDPQSWNGYAYVRNSPLTLVDPDGEDYEACGGGSCGVRSDADFSSWANGLIQAGYKFYGNATSGVVLTKDGQGDGFYRWINSWKIGPLPESSSRGQTQDRIIGAAKGAMDDVLTWFELAGAPESNVNQVKSFFRLHSTSQNQDFGKQVFAMAALFSGGGKTGRKVNEARYEAAKRAAGILEDVVDYLDRLPNKTKATKEAADIVRGKLKDARDAMRKSEPHAVRGQGYRR